ncbi:MAG TPA: preprotein translocase subunit YajC [Bacillota bacterium]|nr:preprotein translocase subunit YajC [Bacillota bacterium]
MLFRALATTLSLATAETPPEGALPALLVNFAPFILIIVVFYFLLIRPQRKKEKQTKEMLAALKVGDNITTIGGICGKVTAIRDDIITVEVGNDKTKLVFERWAIRDVEQLISD